MPTRAWKGLGCGCKAGWVGVQELLAGFCPGVGALVKGQGAAGAREVSGRRPRARKRDPRKGLGGMWEAACRGGTNALSLLTV